MGRMRLGMCLQVWFLVFGVLMSAADAEEPADPFSFAPEASVGTSVAVAPKALYEDPEMLIERLADDHRERRERAQRELLLIGKPSVAPLIAAAKTHPRTQCRAYAAWLLGQLRDAGDEESLVAALASVSSDDPSEFVRYGAMRALCEFPRSETAAKALLVAVRKATPDQRAALRDLTARFGNDILLFFKDASADPETMTWLIGVVGQIPTLEAAKSLSELLENETVSLRQSAIAALSEMADGNPAVVLPVVPIIEHVARNDADATVQRQASLLLANLQRENDSPDSDLLKWNAVAGALEQAQNEKRWVLIRVSEENALVRKWEDAFERNASLLKAVEKTFVCARWDPLQETVIHLSGAELSSRDLKVRTGLSWLPGLLILSPTGIFGGSLNGAPSPERAAQWILERTKEMVQG